MPSNVTAARGADPGFGPASEQDLAGESPLHSMAICPIVDQGRIVSLSIKFAGASGLDLRLTGAASAELRDFLIALPGLCGAQLPSLTSAAAVERVEPPWPDLDDGIRETVRALWDAGFEPTDSGDGLRQGVKADWGDEALDVAHVFMCCEPSALVAEAERLLALVATWGDRFAGPDSGPAVQACYLPGDDVAVLELYGAMR